MVKALVKIKNRWNWIKSYPIDFYYWITWNIPKVVGIEETIQQIISKNASISRFGDGEIDIMMGKSIPFQKFDSSLSLKMKEILKSDDENFLVGIPDIFNGLSAYNENAKKYFKSQLRNNRKNWAKLLKKGKKYYCAEITRPYMDLADKSHSERYFKELTKIWEDKKIIIVEGDKSRLGVGNDLFCGCREIKRVLCPATNAFSYYKEIIEAIENYDKEYLLLLALGPTATVLAYDLYRLGYRALDIGHVDIEYEWYKMGALNKVPVKNKYTNEAEFLGGLEVGEIDDPTYLSQICCKIGC